MTPLREKCPNTELFLVHIFLHLDWMQKNKKKKNGPEKTLHLDTFYTQCSSEYKAFAIRETLQIKLSHNEYKV